MGGGDDTIVCNAVDVAGVDSCISHGGQGADIIFCSITNQAATGSSLCLQSGGSGNDVMTCDKDTIRGQHFCFGDGGGGDDVMNWIVRGLENTGDFSCSMHGGAGNDLMNIQVGTATDPVGGTGTVEYFGDTGTGDDVWNAVANITPESDAVFSSINVLLEEGNDTAVLNFISLGGTQIDSAFISGGEGQDTYFGPPLNFLPFPVVDFEIGT